LIFQIFPEAEQKRQKKLIPAGILKFLSVVEIYIKMSEIQNF
jgi:hypothetical protein